MNLYPASQPPHKNVGRGSDGTGVVVAIYDDQAAAAALRWSVTAGRLPVAKSSPSDRWSDVASPDRESCSARPARGYTALVYGLARR